MEDAKRFFEGLLIEKQIMFLLNLFEILRFENSILYQVL